MFLNLKTYPNPGGGIIIVATVKNQGDKDTMNGFYTDLYVNHLPIGPGDYTGSLSFWVDDPIAAGATVTLTTVVNDLSYLFGNSRLQTLGPTEEVTATIYSQVDSVGGVNESNEANNIYSAGVPVCMATPDAYESDNTFSTASLIVMGQSQIHNFGGPGDQDWVKFTAEAGKIYFLTTSALDSSSDTYLYLYDTDGVTLLASNDDYGGTLASQIIWTAPATGTYYILIRHWNPNMGGCGTRYTLTLMGNPIFLPIIIQ